LLKANNKTEKTPAATRRKNNCFKFTVIIESSKDDGREEKEEGEGQDCQEDEGDQLHIHRQCTYIYKYANI